MTDLEQCRALLDRLEINYIYHDVDKCFQQGNESFYVVIELVQLCSKHTQKWFFYHTIGGKQGDQGKKPGDFWTTDSATLEKQWWPLDEGETRPDFLD